MLGQAWAGSPTAPGPGHPSARGFVPHSGSSASTERGLRPTGGVVLEPGSRPTPQNLSPHLGREVAPGEPTLIPAGCRRAWQRPGPAPGATEWSEPAHRGGGGIRARPAGPWPSRPGPPHAAAPAPSTMPTTCCPSGCGLPASWSHTHPRRLPPATSAQEPDGHPAGSRLPLHSAGGPARAPCPRLPVPMSLLSPWLHRGLNLSSHPFSPDLMRSQWSPNKTTRGCSRRIFGDLHRAVTSDKELCLGTRRGTQVTPDSERASGLGP